MPSRGIGRRGVGEARPRDREGKLRRGREVRFQETAEMRLRLPGRDAAPSEGEARRRARPLRKGMRHGRLGHRRIRPKGGPRLLDRAERVGGGAGKMP